jgi:anti-anti-sigma factor
MARTRHDSSAADPSAADAASVFLVHFAGEYDTSNATEVTARVTRAAGQPFGTVVVDLSGVTFFDSTAIRALVRAHAEVDRRGKDMLVGNVSPQVRRVLELTGVWESLPHYPNGDDGSAA